MQVDWLLEYSSVTTYALPFGIKEMNYNNQNFHVSVCFCMLIPKKAKLNLFQNLDKCTPLYNIPCALKIT